MDEFSFEERNPTSESTSDASKAQVVNLTNNNNPIRTQLDKTGNADHAKRSKRDGLIHHKRELVPYKDFTSEVRALRDIEQFAHQAELILDVNEVNMANIVERMISKVGTSMTGEWPSTNKSKRYELIVCP